MDTVVAESGITLDTRLLSENIIVLAFEIANDLTEARSSSAAVLFVYERCALPCLVVNLISKSRGIDNG